MKKSKKSDEQGFITMVLLLFIIIILAVGFAYVRIKNAQG